MDKAKAVITIYVIIGLLLFLLGSLIVVETAMGTLVLRGYMFYLVILAAFFMIFLGLHWLIVGIASLKSS